MKEEEEEKNTLNSMQFYIQHGASLLMAIIILTSIHKHPWMRKKCDL